MHTSSKRLRSLGLSFWKKVAPQQVIKENPGFSMSNLIHLDKNFKERENTLYINMFVCVCKNEIRSRIWSFIWLKTTFMYLCHLYM